MRFSIERVLEHMAPEIIFYYILNLLYIFKYDSWYYCSCNRFQGCQYRNGEEFYCFICQFWLEYYPRDIEKILDTQKIANIYLSMKRDLKKCIDFDPSISTFWNYHFKFNLWLWRKSMVLLFERLLFLINKKSCKS